MRSRPNPDGAGMGLYKTPQLGSGIPAEPDKGWDYNPFEDRLASINRGIEERLSQCQGLFTALHVDGLAKKSRHTPPLWCGEERYPGMLMRSLDGFRAAGGTMPKPPELTGIEQLSDRLTEAALFDRFMLEFSATIRVEFADIIGPTDSSGTSRSSFENVGEDTVSEDIYCGVEAMICHGAFCAIKAHGGMLP